MKKGERIESYYFSFEATGDESIDAILDAVCMAGTAYHHTEAWDNPDDRPNTPCGWIQAAANKAQESEDKTRMGMQGDINITHAYIERLEKALKPFADIEGPKESNPSKVTASGPGFSGGDKDAPWACVITAREVLKKGIPWDETFYLPTTSR